MEKLFSPIICQGSICTLLFRHSGSFANSAVHYLSIIMLILSLTDKKTALQTKSPRYSLFQPTVKRKDIDNSDPAIYPVLVSRDGSLSKHLLHPCLLTDHTQSLLWRCSQLCMFD